MKCPQCGLVHSPGDHVCRRCEIDLKTLEPASRAAPRSIHMAKNGGLSRLKSKAVISRKPDGKDTLQTETKTTREKKEKSGASIISTLKSAKSNKSVTAIDCVQCGQKMEMERILPFSKRWPAALLALGALLAIAGIFVHLLFITAAISVAAGLLYPRAGNTNWTCHSCGMHIPRA